MNQAVAEVMQVQALRCHFSCNQDAYRFFFLRELLDNLGLFHIRHNAIQAHNSTRLQTQITL